MKLEDIIGLQIIGAAVSMFGAGGVLMLQLTSSSSFSDIKFVLFLGLAVVGLFIILGAMKKFFKISDDKELMRKEI